ncbi:MAG TPA: DUF84 family protein [Bacillota bacterium]|nr:DUF84 family protein [Bacillota bacterium]
MNVMVGSKNPTKIQAVEDVFTGYDVISIDVSSDVSRQPFSDEETRLGAINRAKQAATNDDLGIGLEGGVMYLEDELYLCNWGALVTPQGDIFTASGGRIRLPKEIDTQLQAGYELGDIMDHYANKQSVRSREGAIGIFTNNYVERAELFTHVVKLLKGQWAYWNNEL